MSDREHAEPAELRQRTAVCLDCRTLLVVDERCDCDSDGDAVGIEVATGRAALAKEVWGSPILPALRSLAGVAGGIFWGGAVALVLVVASLLFMQLPVGGLVWALAAGVSMIGVVWFLLARFGGELQPRGTPVHRLLEAGAPGMIGEVSGETTLVAPLTGRSCLAYVVQIYRREFFGGDVMLCDGATCGFDISLFDSVSPEGRRVPAQTVRVPAGRVRIELDDLVEVTDRAAIERFLTGVAAGLASDERRPAVPFDAAREGILLPGTRVELFGELAAPMSYRESNAVLRGVPRIRVPGAR